MVCFGFSFVCICFPFCWVLGSWFLFVFGCIWFLVWLFNCVGSAVLVCGAVIDFMFCSLISSYWFSGLTVCFTRLFALV